MQLHGLVKHLLDGRMKASEERRLFPAVDGDLGEHVGTRETVREQPVEEHVQLRIRQAPLEVIIHASRLTSSTARDQL